MKRAAKGPCGIADAVEYKVWMPVAIKPYLDPTTVFRDAVADQVLGSAAVVVSGGSGDIRFAPKPLAKIGVTEAHVAAQHVTASRLVDG